jgi:hypothetical protein
VTSTPGEVLNAELFEQMHYEVGDKFGDANRAGRAVTMPDGQVVDHQDILIRDHGELGPMLTWRRHKATGPRGKLQPVEDLPLFKVPTPTTWPADIDAISPERWSYILHGTSRGKGGHSHLAPHYAYGPGERADHTYFDGDPRDVMSAVAHTLQAPGVAQGHRTWRHHRLWRRRLIRVVIIERGGSRYVLTAYPLNGPAV